MPTFEMLPLNEAVKKSAMSGKRGQVLADYLGFIEHLGEGNAGRLAVGAGETVGAVRRRLGAAAKLAGKSLVIKRVGQEVLFWAAPQPARKRGRPRKSRA